jgi:hypothetical protein
MMAKGPTNLKIIALAAAAVMSGSPALTTSLITPSPSDRSATTKVIRVAAETPEPSPEQKMRARFPQPVKVGDLFGLPVLDSQDRTIGYVDNVVRSKAGKIRLIVPYSSWLGWPKNVGPLASLRRPVAVPIEVVAILGRQIDALDMDRPDFDKAPTWTANGDTPIAKDEIIRIAIGRR